MFKKWLIPVFLLAFFTSLEAQPIELGKVDWLRNHDEALNLSEKTGMPILILFQEVPGCSTCTGYGKEVLSHPLLVEGIESLFIPLCIYNNKGGNDREILSYYKEPTWNNPVVRFVNHHTEDLVPRLARDYSRFGLVSKMISALTITGKEIPEYLHLLEQEFFYERLPKETAYLSMYCFWSGEKVLGDMEGVASTEAGYMDGKEVVKVEFVPGVGDFSNIVKNAKRASCGDAVYTDAEELARSAAKVLGEQKVREEKTYRKDREDKYYLRGSSYRKIPMTPLQAQKVNSFLGQGKDPAKWLSPRQVEMYNKYKNDPTAEERWNRVWVLE
jgi:hypothetical protein